MRLVHIYIRGGCVCVCVWYLRHLYVLPMHAADTRIFTDDCPAFSQSLTALTALQTLKLNCERCTAMLFVEACVQACCEFLRMEREFVLRELLSADACCSELHGR